MKFKNSLKNYGTLLIAPAVHIPIALLLKVIWLITDLGEWVEENICSRLPKLDMDYSEDIQKSKKEAMDRYFNRTVKKKE